MRRFSVMLSAATALITSAPALAQDSPPGWVRKPSSEDLLAVWPRQALKQGLGGSAVVSCTVTVQGTLRQCQVASETPPGIGFGSAALVLTQQFLMKPARKAGQPVESTVRIPINFPRPDRATGSHIRPATDTPFEGERVATNLPWREAPTYTEALAAYPAKARASKISGFVTLDCRLTKEGRLTACETAREEPKGYGFGQAARSLAPKFLGPTQGPDGKPLGRIRTHVTFAFAAEALDTTAPVIGRPRWTMLPSMDDFASVLPPAARRAEIYKARVVISCTVGQGGMLEACKPQSEEPAGLGYADAALTLSRAFRLNTWTDEGLPTIGGSVRIPIRFDLEEAARVKAPVQP